MRLWHEELLRKLPRQQLLGQDRECCALRGGYLHNLPEKEYSYKSRCSFSIESLDLGLMLYRAE